MLPVTVRVAGTCGEWVQGWLDGEAVLVSCPIDRRIEVRLTRSADGSVCLPAGCTKAACALERVRALLGQAHAGAKVDILNPLPRGRGYASSTADIVGVSVAMAAALGAELSPEQLGRLACEIEPSDGIMFPGWSLFAYRSGEWHRPLGEGVCLPLVILDPGESVDTVIFNRKLDLQRVRVLEPQTRESLALMGEGLRRRSAEYIGAAARLSASAYQQVAASRLVEQAMGWAQALHAYGPVRAHSGSIVGIVFDTDFAALDAIAWLRRRFAGDVVFTHTACEGVGRAQNGITQRRVPDERSQWSAGGLLG